MLRICGGEKRGLRLFSPKVDWIRPTTERVREALFSRLIHLIPDSRVLDLFAGSGILGLEAISRGAKQAVFVDQNRQALQLVQKNLTKTGMDQKGITIKGSSVSSALYHQLTKKMLGPFDLIFLDPPYGKGLAEKALNQLTDSGLLASEVYVIVEQGSHDAEKIPSPWQVEEVRSYGSSEIVYCRL
ncbi:MAG: 16S rRNA (guanine(966)-N(2))-methyltransferase RsmD [Magnetococcales bacterium]|nr:16S rRNA (guanine(966)-N(2))-methyltransferase RsmD [Magnetococcales bacterium]